MDYDVVKTAVQDAYRNYKTNDVKFYDAMGTFYKEGEKNPSVARVILQDHIKKGQLAASDMLNQAALIDFTPENSMFYTEAAARQNRLYNASISLARKSLDAADLYQNTEYMSEDIGLQERKQFDKKWAELYPKTGKIRERIIEANRLSADNVTKKASWYEKINFAKTFAEYRKNYPKTFYARVYLIMNNQVKEGDVTPKVKGWYKRFFYKSFIKNGFKFKGGK